MEIKLKKWVELSDTTPGEVYNRKVADIVSQMLNWILEGNVGISLNESSLRIDDNADFTDPNVFGEYICNPVKSYTVDDGSIKPKNYFAGKTLEDSDSVYVAGLILYFMVTEELPLLNNDELFFAQAKRTGAVLELPNSSFNKLVQALTEADPNARISAKEALNMLAEQYPADARIKLLEKDSNVEISTESIPLKSAETVWVCGESHREFRGIPFQFCENELKLPYRAAGLTREVKITFFKENVSLASKLGIGGKYIGIDIGSNRTKISVLENKKIYTCPIDGEYSVPTASEYNGNLYFFLADKDEKVFLKRNDDSQIEISRQMAAEDFFRRLLTVCDGCDGICFTYSNEHMELLDNVRKAVFADKKNVSFSSSLRSAGTAFLQENNLKGNVLLLDVGASEARVGIFTCDSDYNSLEWRIENSISGGRSVTDGFYEKLLLHLDAVNIPMRSLNDSRLTMERFRHNIEVLRAAAENLKCTMSFSRENVPLIVDIGLARPNSTIQHIPVDSIGCGLWDVSRRYADDVFGFIKETISKAGLSERNINYIVINGKAAISPPICDGIKEIFRDSDCRIIEQMSDITLQARGAAMSSFLGTVGENEVAAPRIFTDIGIAVTSASSGSVPEFRQLLQADTAFVNGKVFFAYRTAIQSKDLEDGSYVLRLYKRDKGCNEKYLNGINEEIKYFGRVLVNIPDDYNFENNMLMFKLWVDTYDKLSAEVTIERKAVGVENIKNMFGRLFGKGNYVERDGYFILRKPSFSVEMKSK